MLLAARALSRPSTVADVAPANSEAREFVLAILRERQLTVDGVKNLLSPAHMRGSLLVRQRLEPAANERLALLR